MMSSKDRVPPPNLRHPFPNPGVVHPDPYGSAIHPQPAAFPSFEMLPHPDILEQKLSAQHAEIVKLATENRKLAATHETLRQDLATATNELQLVHSRIANVTSEKEQKTREILNKMSAMEAELKSAEPIKIGLQKARAEAQSLVAARQELIPKVQQLTRDLQMAHSEAQQIPPLMSELDSLRQEYQHSRATYDYEKKLYNDHLESLQVMEMNYTAMLREVGKLRAELSNFTKFDPRTGGSYGGSAGYGNAVHMGNYVSSQSAYAVVQQGQTPLGGGGNAAPRGPVYNEQRPPAYDIQRGSGNVIQSRPGYNPTFTGTVGPQGQVSRSNSPYASTTPGTGALSGYGSVPQGGHPVSK